MNYGRGDPAGGPDAKTGVGEPAGSKEVAKGCTEATRPVGPTLKQAWGNRPEVKRSRSDVPKRSGRWARR